MDAKQLRNQIVRPALQAIGLHSPAAENLVMGTAAQESRLKYVKQLNGPALGLWQMEPPTYEDHWTSYLAYQPELVDRILRAIEAQDKPGPERMVWDLRFACIMCRIDYRREPQALPDFDDIWGLGHYYKRFYNTLLGKATVQEFVQNYRLVA